MQSYKQHFSRFFTANPDRLHVAAHSHHLWPDVAYDAHVRAWDDAARLADRKWEHVLGEVAPALRERIAKILGVPKGDSIVFAPNTHEFVVRLASCLPTPARVLTTDAEFHSFSRQCERWREAGAVQVDRVAAEPFETFADRLVEVASAGSYDLIYVSHVHFNSGYVLPDAAIASLAATAGDGRFVVLDGYHAFCALPVDLSAVADRVFYIAGGYKYAMSGEGICFMHCPPGFGARPVNTGWYAGFGDLERTVQGVGYSTDGMRFAGATFDPSGMYRMSAVLEWLDDIGVTVADIHRRVRELQKQFLGGIPLHGPEPVAVPNLLLDPAAERGHFLSFRTPRAEHVYRALAATGVTTDVRGDRLRFGFGLYHDMEDVEEAVRRCAAVG
jgi:selenocysteine lyase/cysteine desulfurase